MQKQDVLVLIPAWNEALRIGQVIRALPGGFPVLVVDDGSSDATAEVARGAGAEVLIHETNQGKGVALMGGFRWALERGFRAVLTLDADGQHDPGEANLFIEAYQRGKADLIIGRRSFREMPFPRNYANRLGSWMLSRVLRTKIYDNQSGYRMHSRTLMENLSLRHAGFEFEVDLILQALQKGLRLDWVNIRTIYNVDKTSYFHPIRDTLRFIGVVWYAYRNYRRA
ncbi:MAG: glycosyltransferase family 2 protein [Anaerolineales bacterium]|nr:MAG: glycosyltransferase family 2 protein [Anaerolineales bacterium]